jgi:hypothetical protein
MPLLSIGISEILFSRKSLSPTKVTQLSLKAESKLKQIH